MKKFVLVMMILFSSNFLFGQVGQAALPWLYFQRSPLYRGTGDIGVSNCSDKVSGFYFNPAMLGYAGKENHLSMFMLPKQKYFPDFDYPTVNFSGINIGYNLKNSFFKFPVSFGIGVIYDKMDYGYFNITKQNNSDVIGKINTYDIFKGLSIGFGFDYFLKFNIGMSIKFIESNLGKRWYNNKLIEIKDNVTALDYGFLIVAPLTELFFDKLKYRIDARSYVFPVSTLSIGASLLNYGDKVVYFDGAQSDPLPRQSLLGYTFNIGGALKIKNTVFNFIDYSFSAQVNDVLVSNTDNSSWNYKNAFADFKFFNNLIELNYDNPVYVHKGHILSLLETIKITSGRVNGEGINQDIRSGYAVSTKGVFKLLSLLINNSTIDYLFNHFEFSYFNYQINTNNFIKNDYSAFAIVFKNFAF